MKMGVESTPEMSCISSISQTMDNAQHNVLIEETIVVQLVKKFLVISGTPRFITVFKRSLLWPLS
jgi:hypothetical protein